MLHLVRLIAAIAVVIFCTFFPFLPGRYESLAIPLSVMAQIVGKVGLLLVPVGVIWLVVELSSRQPTKRYVLGVVALVVWSVVWLCVSVGALVSSGFALAVVTAALGIFIVISLWRRLRVVRGAVPGRDIAVPLSLVAGPVAVLAIQFAFGDRAAESSRSRAIRNSAQLIADIEQYRVRHSQYPSSLWSVWEDHQPGVIGIDRYHYEPSGDSFNLIFEQTSLVFGTREFVVYNPRDEQGMTSHNMDRLRVSPDQLRRGRGYYAALNAAQPHWKIFLFD